MHRLDPRSEVFVHALQRLQAICRRAKRLPASCYLTDEDDSQIIDSARPVARTATSCVFQGHREGTLMAYKSLRKIAGEDEDVIERVCLHLPCDEISAQWRGRRIMMKSSSGNG
jgi:hypothetical protein